MTVSPSTSARLSVSVTSLVPPFSATAPAGALIDTVVSSPSVSVTDAAVTASMSAPLPDTVMVSSNSSVESAVGVTTNVVVADA